MFMLIDKELRNASWEPVPTFVLDKSALMGFQVPSELLSPLLPDAKSSCLFSPPLREPIRQ